MKRSRLIVAGVVAVAAIAVGAGFAAAGRDGEALEGRAYDRATAAALQHVGEGKVTEAELGDGAAAYEVEIRLDAGSHVEVQLDDHFEVLRRQADDDPNDGRDD